MLVDLKVYQYSESMKARLIDIAKLAGVSPSTVSLVLRGKSAASAETCRKILAIAEQNGHIPAATAPTHRNKELTFAKIIKHGNILNPDHFLFVNDYIDGIISQAGVSGYGVIVDSFDLRTVSMHRVLSQLTEYSSAGIIILATELAPEDLKQFEALSIPFVFLDAYYDFLPYSFFDMNNTDSLFQILEYLKHKGHRKIGMCSAQCESANYQRRRTDFNTCLEKLNLEEYDMNRFYIRNGKMQEYAEIKEALQTYRLDLPTALFCVSDALALTVMKAAKELSISIPEELSLVGFDNLDVDDIITPALTSVDVPKRTIAQEATASLIQMIEMDTPYTPKKVLLSGKIVYRESVSTLKKQSMRK